MNADVQRIFEEKRGQRRKLAALPIAEKLRMLDAMRERAFALRNAATLPSPVEDVGRRVFVQGFQAVMNRPMGGADSTEIISQDREDRL